MFCALSLFMVSCNGNSSSKNISKTIDKAETPVEEKVIEFVNTLRLKSPHRGDIFAEGKEVEFNVHVKKKAEDVDSIQVWANNVLVETRKDDPWKWKWKVSAKKMGRMPIKIMAYHEDGKIGLINTFINVKSGSKPTDYSYEIVNSYPHDRRSYTQGLFFHNGYLYEGTGQKGESSLKKVKLEDGKAMAVKDLEQEYFGEGITYYNGKIIQLTWQEKIAFVVDANTFEQLDSFVPQTSKRDHESWGITTMKSELVLSDGSNILTILDANNYDKKRSIEVYDQNGAVTNLNELEYINGKIYANVWLTDRIVIIDPQSGKVEGNIVLGSILKKSDKNKLAEGDDVLNGIAWDEKGQRLFVTGKRWPKLFEIKISKK
jgi:glutamine cyclotransferase